MVYQQTQGEYSMKAPKQALQSRISKRRDIIRQLEDARLILKSTITLYVGYNIDISDVVNQYRQVKANLKVLRDDQKLDKVLYVLLLRFEANDRAIEKYIMEENSFYGEI
jgi:hypothetical protein